MTVYKNAATGPDPAYTYESWISYVESELTVAFTTWCVTKPVAHYNTQMSTPILLTAPGALYYATIVAWLKVPH